MKKRLFLAAAIAASAMAVSANAATINLFSTGVDGSGNKLAEGAADTHWTVSPGNTISSTPITGNTAYVYDHPSYLQAPDAKFIAVATDGSYTNPVNTFTLDFNIAGSFTSAVLKGFLEADNYATVYLNGVAIAQDIQDTVYPNFQSETPFTSLSGIIHPGENVLQVLVTDTGPPSAVQMSGLSVLTTGVPEPASWALMIAGLGLVGGSLRANRKNAVAAA